MVENIVFKSYKIVACLKNLCYQNRLVQLKLTTLYERRIRGDLIQIFKIFTGINTLSFQRNLAYATGPSVRVRGLSHNLAKPSKTNNCSQRENFFLYRVVNHWNSLPKEVVSANSLNNFKNRLDKHLFSQRLFQEEERRMHAILLN